QPEALAREKPRPSLALRVGVFSVHRPAKVAMLARRRGNHRPPGATAMKTATGTTLIRNGRLIDGTGAPPVPDASLLIKDGHIAYAGPAAALPEPPPGRVEIDARGGTIMPGLVEAHFHPTYFNVAALEDLDIKYPVEYVTLLAAANAKLALECGY